VLLFANHCYFLPFWSNDRVAHVHWAIDTWFLLDEELAFVRVYIYLLYARHIFKVYERAQQLGNAALVKGAHRTRWLLTLLELNASHWTLNISSFTQHIWRLLPPNDLLSRLACLYGRDQIAFVPALKILRGCFMPLCIQIGNALIYWVCSCSLNYLLDCWCRSGFAVLNLLLKLRILILLSLSYFRVVFNHVRQIALFSLVEDVFAE